MSRSTVILLATSMAVLLGAAGAARADTVYEWTDAHGQVHYTDQWVPGAKLVTTVTAHRPADSGAMQGIQKESSSRFGRPQAAAGGPIRAGRRGQGPCRPMRAGKAEYQKLIESRRIFTTDKSGNRTYLSDADADALPGSRSARPWMPTAGAAASRT